MRFIIIAVIAALALMASGASAKISPLYAAVRSKRSVLQPSLLASLIGSGIGNCEKDE